MEPLYKPEGVEARWQKTWEAEGLYNADPDPSRESFALLKTFPGIGLRTTFEPLRLAEYGL